MWICAYNIYHWLRLALAFGATATSQSMCDSTLTLVRSLILSIFLSLSISIYLSRTISFVRSFDLFLFIFIFFLQLIGLIRIVTTAVPHRQACMCVCAHFKTAVWYYSIRNEISYLLSYEIVSTNTIVGVHCFCYARARASANICTMCVWCCSCCCIQRILHLVRIDMLAVTKFIAGCIVPNHIQISNTMLFFLAQTDSTRLIYWQWIHARMLWLFLLFFPTFGLLLPFVALLDSYMCVRLCWKHKNHILSMTF